MQLLYFLLPAVTALSPDDFLLIGDVTRFAGYGLAMIMLLFAPLAHYKSGNFAPLWSLASFLLYTRWLAALNLPTAPYLSAFQISLGKTLPPRNIFNLTQGKATSQEKIRTLGAENVLFLRNSGLILLILTGIALVLGVVSLLGKGKRESCAHLIRWKVQYSACILASLLTFQDLLIFSLLQVQGAEFNSEIAIFSLLLSVLFVVFAITFTLFVPITLCKGQNRGKFGILTEGMRAGVSPGESQHYSLYLLQRWGSAVLYVLLDCLPELQFSLTLTMEMVVLAYMLYSRPYTRRGDNAAVSLLQAMVCVLVLLEGCFCGNWSDRGSFLLTLAFIGTYWLGIFLCFARFALGFSSKNTVSPITPVFTLTEVSTAEVKLRAEKTVVEDDKVISQTPNNHYSQMAKPATPLRVKSLCRVTPNTPVALSQERKVE